MKRFIFSLAVAFSLQANAEITELNSYSDLNRESLKGAVVVFDIDNTLLRQEQMIGTHQWGDDFRERAIERGVPEKEARELQLKTFAEVQPFVSVVPVEEKVRDLLAYLDSNKIPHFALTARPRFATDITIKQLKTLNHDFAKSFPAQKDPSALKEFLTDGVIFSGETPKGELLKLIVENSVQKPTKIVFIDDKRYNLESVEKSLVGSGIKIESRRYGGADAVVASYDRAIADLEYSFFVDANSLISDDMARELNGDYRAITRERFTRFLDDPWYNHGDCEEALDSRTELTRKFRCYYMADSAYDDQMPMQVDFDYSFDSARGSISFGNW